MALDGSDQQKAVAGGRIRRAAPLAAFAARTAGEEVLDRVRRRAGRLDPIDGSGPLSSDRHARNAERYVELMGRSKGALMKAGQMLSFTSLTGTVPEEQRALYQQALSRLQADAPPMAPELAESVLEAELGKPVDRIFSKFDSEPLAAASIGQVHRAVTSDGRDVAVKVQYPGVEKAIRDDLKNTELLATFFSVVRAITPSFTRIDLHSMAEEISARITEELDYLNEASNQRWFADAYQNHPFIHIPQVVEELTTRRVLTQEFVEGLRWAEALKTEDQHLKDTWAEVIFRFSIGSLRRLHVFNADPHPGNYLFHLDGTVSFVDFGCVKRFSQEQALIQRGIVWAMIDKDPDRLRELFVEAGVIGGDGPSADDLYEWWSESMELMFEPQPYTITPEKVAAGLRREFSPVGPSARVVRSITSPPEWVFLTRIDTGMMSVLGQLGATNDWVRLERELDGLSGPATALGELEQRWRDSR